MTNEASAGPERVRTAEVVAALCLATDLAMGFPFEHGLHATRIAARLGDRLAIDPETASETYYACLLSYCGCTADAEIAAGTYGGDLMANPRAGPVRVTARDARRCRALAPGSG